ncbi:MAG: hypothetical protein HGA42_01975, partial [Nostocales cyanobacterium W4_Combined_metabat2_030]|nr:hypothetical protein [Nostocales cyanobacterium W4_Combined_metabat2_030]
MTYNEIIQCLCYYDKLNPYYQGEKFRKEDRDKLIAKWKEQQEQKNDPRKCADVGQKPEKRSPKGRSGNGLKQ